MFLYSCCLFSVFQGTFYALQRSNIFAKFHRRQLSLSIFCQPIYPCDHPMTSLRGFLLSPIVFAVCLVFSTDVLLLAFAETFNRNSVLLLPLPLIFRVIFIIVFLSFQIFLLVLGFHFYHFPVKHDRAKKKLVQVYISSSKTSKQLFVKYVK